MKKMGYMISLLFYIAVLMNCAGQTCCIESEYFMQSVLLSGNFQTIEYQAVPNGNQIENLVAGSPKMLKQPSHPESILIQTVLFGRMFTAR